MARLLVEGRLELNGPGGEVSLEASGDCVRLRFSTLQVALRAWRAVRMLPVFSALDKTGVSVEIYVRGIRVRQFGRV